MEALGSPGGKPCVLAGGMLVGERGRFHLNGLRLRRNPFAWTRWLRASVLLLVWGWWRQAVLSRCRPAFTWSNWLVVGPWIQQCPLRWRATGISQQRTGPRQRRCLWSKALKFGRNAWSTSPRPPRRSQCRQGRQYLLHQALSLPQATVRHSKALLRLCSTLNRHHPWP